MERSSQFSVALVHTAAEFKQISCIPNVIVFPEGVDEREIWQASNMCPDSVVVAAVRVWEEKTVRMRGVVWHQGQNHIDYLKVSTDHRTSAGTRKFNQNPVVSFHELDISIGVLICMDIDNAETSPMFRDKVIDSLKTSSLNKLLCITADMIGSEWEDCIAAPSYRGVYVALCNQPQTPGQVRTKSFVANMDGEKYFSSVVGPTCINLPAASP